MARQRNTDQEQNLVVQDPELEAFKLRLAGKSHYEITEAGLGYQSTTAVSNALRARLSREARLISGETRESLLELELARLDALQAAVWDEAMSGEPKAVDTATKIVLARVKVLGLDIPDASSAAQTVLVIHGDEDNYIKQLKEAHGGLKQENETRRANGAG